MLSLSDYIGMDATSLAEGIRNRNLSCAEITACAIERAEAINPTINAINIECYEAAIKQAKSFDANPELLNQSRLAGFPFLIKDLSHVRGLVSTMGSRLYDGYIADRNRGYG